MPDVGAVLSRRATKLLMLVATTAFTSCVTSCLLRARPITHVIALERAGESDHGCLIVDVRFSDGDEWFFSVVRKDDAYAGDVLYRHDESIPTLWAYHPNKDHQAIHFTGDTARRLFGGDATIYVAEPSGILIKDKDGAQIGFLTNYAHGYNWSHPGTWACVSLLPASIALDLVLLPFECVCLAACPDAYDHLF